MKYKGRCHCGKVSFEVEGEIKNAMACNCSICQRKGSLLWFVPREKLSLLTPDEAHERWSGIRFDTRVVHTPDAGRLDADEAVVALQSEATRHS